MAYITGSAGNDTIYGTIDGDQIVDMGGNNSIYASDGNDSITVGDGDNTIAGSAGVDTIIVGNGNNFIDTGLGVNDKISIGAGWNTVFVGRSENGANTINVDFGHSKIYTSVGRNEFYINYHTYFVTPPQNASHHTIYGNSDNDYVFMINLERIYDFGDHFYLLDNSLIGVDIYDVEQVVGGSLQTRLIYNAAEINKQVGNDFNNLIYSPLNLATRLVGLGGNDTLYGSMARDSVFGGWGDDYIASSGDNDTVIADVGNDTIDGDEGNDYIWAGAGNDLLYGGDGNDILYSGWGSDTVYGGEGGDVVINVQGSDLVYLGNGGDYYKGNAECETIYTGAGNDTLDLFTTLSSHENISYFTESGYILFGEDVYSPFGENGDYIYCGPSGQTVRAGNGWNYIDGADGNDSLYGGKAGDLIYGANGDDVISGISFQATSSYEYGYLTGDISVMPGVRYQYLTNQIGPDSLFGGDGNDTIYAIGEASGGPNTVSGDAGDDKIFINGVNAGNRVHGGSGLDTYTIDFRHDPMIGSNNWVQIQDFDPLIGEKIVIKTYDHFVPDLSGYNVWDDPSGVRIILGTSGAYQYDVFLLGHTKAEFTANWFSVIT